MDGKTFGDLELGAAFYLAGVDQVFIKVGRTRLGPFFALDTADGRIVPCSDKRPVIPAAGDYGFKKPKHW